MRDANNKLTEALDALKSARDVLVMMTLIDKSNVAKKEVESCEVVLKKYGYKL